MYDLKRGTIDLISFRWVQIRSKALLLKGTVNGRGNKKCRGGKGSEEVAAIYKWTLKNFRSINSVEGKALCRAIRPPPEQRRVYYP
jgi:hypothetical protein